MLVSLYRGRRVLQVDDLHRTRVRRSRSRYWSIASHSRAARPLALLLTRIALACGAAARVTGRSHRTRVRRSRLNPNPYATTAAPGETMVTQFPSCITIYH